MLLLCLGIGAAAVLPKVASASSRLPRDHQTSPLPSKLGRRIPWRLQILAFTATTNSTFIWPFLWTEEQGTCARDTIFFGSRL
ncbi:hypothetical protein IWX92DRAFT_355718, partial [Phyllosticta citricarpa]